LKYKSLNAGTGLLYIETKAKKTMLKKEYLQKIF